MKIALFLIVIVALSHDRLSQVMTTSSPTFPQHPHVVQEADDPWIAVGDGQDLELGELDPGVLTTRRVTLLNQSVHSVTIRITRTTCSCVSVRILLTTLRPGESTDLELSVLPAPVVAKQVHAFELECRSLDGVADPVQRLVTTIGFSARVSLQIIPEEVRVHATRGVPFTRTIFIQAGEIGGVDVHGITSTLDRITAGVPRMLAGRDGANVFAVDVQGMFSEIGVGEGWLEVQSNAVQERPLRARILVRVEPDWRTEPSGAVFLLDGRGGKTQLYMTLLPAVDGAELPKPSIVRLTTPVSGVDVSIEQDRDSSTPRLRISLDLESLPSPTGSVEVDVFDADGTQRVRFPVVWHMAR